MHLNLRINLSFTFRKDVKEDRLCGYEGQVEGVSGGLSGFRRQRPQGVQVCQPNHKYCTQVI